MADAEEADEAEARPGARFVIRDHLPGDRVVYPVVVDGEMVWLVLRGHMTQQLCDGINEYLRHIVDSGMWDQQHGHFIGEPDPDSLDGEGPDTSGRPAAS